MMVAAGLSAVPRPLLGERVRVSPSLQQVATGTESDIESFHIDVPESDLQVLRRRLDQLRWPKFAPGEAWSYGTDRQYLEELMSYWRSSYDWRIHEANLNQYSHYRTTIEGQELHFIHQEGKGNNSFPLVMTHGWPGTIWELLPVIGLLANPMMSGADEFDSFDVVVPSIPGFGFSGEPLEGTDVIRTAELWIALMDKLGYSRFGAYGSDWGMLVTRHLGARFPNQVVGIATPGTPPRERRAPVTEAEREYEESSQRWSIDETGYSHIQGTKPQTLSYGLNDSPVGLAAWVTEKLRSWSDCGGDIESRFSKDQILTLISIYWHTQTIDTSVRYYYANGSGSSRGRTMPGPSVVPEAYFEFLGMAERSRPPRSFFGSDAEDVAMWSVHNRGGHFPGIEEPELLAQDLRSFFRPLRVASRV
tara:strand:- start:4773 stop:6029 length:1257 start_codon:yes stop_codon:yes gene_type:complete